MDPAQQATYDAAMAFLVESTSNPNFKGPPTVSKGPSAIAKAYDENQMADVSAGTGWAAGSSGASDFKLSSSYLNTSRDSKSNSYGAMTAFSVGLWSVSGGAEHSDTETNSHMDANNVSISAKLTLVRIMRPWLDTTLFRTDGWWLKGQPVGAVSNGALDGNTAGMMPLIPVAFVVMSDVMISADFSEDDKKHIDSATSGSASVGWGPFSVSGHYSHSDSKDMSKATFDGGSIRVPGSVA